MEVVQCRSFEKGNAWLQEWIREELAQGEAWQKQHETLLERQAWLCSLVRAKSLKPLEKKNWAWQKELEEAQEALQECQSRRSQCRLQVHKQEKENQRMAESVTELEKKVFKQQWKQKTGRDRLKEMKAEGSRLQRHLSVWEAACKVERERVRERQLQLELRSSVLQEESLRSQERPRNKTLLEDGVMEAQLETNLCFLGPALRTAWFLLWALAKALFLLLFLMVVFYVLYGFFSGSPCPRPNSAPLLYIQPKVQLPPFYS